MPVDASALVCPGCGARADAGARFCPGCGLPLVFDGWTGADDDALGTPDGGGRAAVERRRRLQKIKPQLAEGPLVKVAWARNQAEGEWVQGLLLESGVPSLLRRSAGFDVPDMLAAGPRDVMVPASGVDIARETLLDAQVIDGASAGRPAPRPVRLLAGLCLGLAAGAVLIWLVYLALR